MAALVAYQLRNCPSLRAGLSGASGVMASGYGTPPVLTRELAVAAGGYIRTLVHSVREWGQQWEQRTVVKLAAHVVPDVYLLQLLGQCLVNVVDHGWFCDSFW